MAVRVQDLLCLEKMKHAAVLAGKGGLDRQVKRIATIEKPCVDHLKYSYEVSEPGDLYLSKLYVFKREKEKLYKELAFMRDTDSSGLITHKDNKNLLDARAMDLADQYQIPLILIDEQLGFAELTYQIIDLIIQDRIAGVNEHTLMKILKNGWSVSDIRESFLHMEPELQENIVAVFIKSEERINPSMFSVEKGDLCLPLFQGILYIMSLADADKAAEKEKLNRLMEKLKKTIGCFRVGKSKRHSSLEECKEAALEAIYACTYAEFSQCRSCEAENLGIYGVLLGMKEKDRLYEFRQACYGPLLAYEKENHLELISALELFIKSEGDYKYVAEQLFVHETTVRYRLNKIKDILGVQNWMTFYADARVAVYADWILNHALLNQLS